MTETLRDIYALIPVMVAEHPRIQELRKKIATLCNGSEFEKAAVELYYEKVARNRFGLETRLSTRNADQMAKETRVLNETEIEEKMPGLKKSYPEGFSSMVFKRESQIENTLSQFVDEQRKLAGVFRERFKELQLQVIKAKMPGCEAEHEAKADVVIQSELEGDSDDMIKAVLTRFDEEILHMSDLKTMVVKTE